MENSQDIGYQQVMMLKVWQTGNIFCQKQAHNKQMGRSKARGFSPSLSFRNSKGKLVKPLNKHHYASQIDAPETQDYLAGFGLTGNRSGLAAGKASPWKRTHSWLCCGVAWCHIQSEGHRCVREAGGPDIHCPPHCRWKTEPQPSGLWWRAGRSRILALNAVDPLCNLKQMTMRVTEKPPFMVDKVQKRCQSCSSKVFNKACMSIR